MESAQNDASNKRKVEDASESAQLINLQYIITYVPDMTKAKQFWESVLGYKPIGYDSEHWSELKIENSPPKTRNTIVALHLAEPVDAAALEALVASRKAAGGLPCGTIGLNYFVPSVAHFHKKVLEAGGFCISEPEKQAWGAVKADYLDLFGNPISAVEISESFAKMMGRDPSVSNLEYAVINTNDFARTKKLLTSLLGVKVAHEEGEWVEFTLQSSDSKLSLHRCAAAAASAEPEKKDSESSFARPTLGFFVSDIESFHAKVLEHSEDVTVVSPPVKSPWGGHIAAYHDFNGTSWSVLERPNFDQPEDAASGIPIQASSISIPVLDMNRAQKFYGAVAKWTFQPWSPEKAAFDTRSSSSSASGSLVKVDSAASLLQFPVITLGPVADLETTLAAVTENGGVVVDSNVQEEGGKHKKAHVRDSEGNLLAIVFLQ